MIRDSRTWTSVAVIGLGLLTISNGLPLARLGLMEAQEANDGAFRAAAGKGPAGAEAARWLVGHFSVDDPQLRLRDLGRRLRGAPLSAGAWLDLAIARRAAGDKTENVLTALALSSMTGPNEAALMAGRAGFALPFWSALPPDAQRSLISDIAGAWETMSLEDRDRLAAIAQNAPEDAGEHIRAALLTYGEDGAKVAKAMFPAREPSK